MLIIDSVVSARLYFFGFISQYFRGINSLKEESITFMTTNPGIQVNYLLGVYIISLKHSPPINYFWLSDWLDVYSSQKHSVFPERE